VNSTVKDPFIYLYDLPASSAILEGMNRRAEDPNQNIGLAKEQVNSEVAGIGNPVDVQLGMSHYMVIARLFPWKFAFVRGEHQPSVDTDELDDIREMQELAFVRNTSKIKARAG
jgi:hypothetical protein